jgi:hypothetical protein
VAGGNYHSTANYLRAAIWIFSGGKWAAARSPVPANAATKVIPGDQKNGPFSGINAISCPPSAKPRCIAVGDYVANEFEHQGFFLEVPNDVRIQGVLPVVRNTTQAPTTTPTLAAPPTSTSTSTTTSSIPTTTPTTAASAAGSPPCTVAALTSAAEAGDPNATGVDPNGYGCSGNWAYAGVALSSQDEVTMIFMAVNGSWQTASVQLDCTSNSSSPTLPPSILQAACNSN